MWNVGQDTTKKPGYWLFWKGFVGETVQNILRYGLVWYQLVQESIVDLGKQIRVKWFDIANNYEELLLKAF